MRYIVVIADHDGQWHGVGGADTWESALAVFGGVIGTLTATDYYDEAPPSVVKIIPANETEYATATPLEREAGEDA